jgi:predicted ATPase
MLVDKSLARSSSKGAAEPRFAMLEPLREYALEHLAARGKVEALRRAHASYYLALAEAVAAQWDTPIADALIKQLDRERDNLRAALRWGCDGGDLTIGLRLAGRCASSGRAAA